jgi:predicted enzyme related to lactoylglutathione lyase
MTAGFQTVLFPAKDLAATKAVFNALIGVAPIADEPYYVGWRVEGQDIGLVPGGHDQGMTGAVAYWNVDDIKETVDRLVAAGAEIKQPISNVGGGKQVATVTDPEGNVIGVSQAP